MKAEFEKIFSLFVEFEEAGQAVTLTFASREGKCTVKLQLESATTSSSPSPASPAPGQRCYHRGPRARASGQLPTEPPWLTQLRVFHLMILSLQALSPRRRKWRIWEEMIFNEVRMGGRATINVTLPSIFTHISTNIFSTTTCAILTPTTFLPPQLQTSSLWDLWQMCLSFWWAPWLPLRDRRS